ncbi:MAG: Crp/Fnr family transcriptional regulator [Gammaproteobacteria bacterium]|nr:Crp/Fnr family transcriptional regulator [Gammaproteobacteria bacterium]
MTVNWQQTFPHLNQVNDAVINELMNNAGTITMPAKATAFHQGDACSNYLLILSGSIKVMTRAENGREIVLYRLGDGDSCVLTTSCLFGNARYPAEGVSETDVTALAIPAEEFHRAIQQSKPFREFVFSSFSSHLGSLISLVEEVAFGRLDTRLARHLLKLGGTDRVLETTHQQLATELGSAREVISRQLKDFESRGWVKLQRGSIEIIDTQSLQALATV